MDKVQEISARRIGELLGAHASRPDAGATQTVAGLVSVSVDARLRLTSVQLHDKSLPAEHRTALEKAIVEAVNGARLQSLKGASEALSRLRESAEWRSAMDGVFGPGSTA